MKEFEVVIKQKVEYEVSIWVEAEDVDSAIRSIKHLYKDSVTVPEMSDSTVGCVYSKEYSCQL